MKVIDCAAPELALRKFAEDAREYFHRQSTCHSYCIAALGLLAVRHEDIRTVDVYLLSGKASDAPIRFVNLLVEGL